MQFALDSVDGDHAGYLGHEKIEQRHAQIVEVVTYNVLVMLH